MTIENRVYEVLTEKPQTIEQIYASLPDISNDVIVSALSALHRKGQLKKTFTEGPNGGRKRLYKRNLR